MCNPMHPSHRNEDRFDHEAHVRDPTGANCATEASRFDEGPASTVDRKPPRPRQARLPLVSVSTWVEDSSRNPAGFFSRGTHWDSTSRPEWRRDASACSCARWGFVTRYSPRIWRITSCESPQIRYAFRDSAFRSSSWRCRSRRMSAWYSAILLLRAGPEDVTRSGTSRTIRVSSITNEARNSPLLSSLGARVPAACPTVGTVP